MICTVAGDGANCHLIHGHGEDVYVCTALLIFFNATNTVNIVTHYGHFSKYKGMPYDTFRQSVPYLYCTLASKY